MAITIVTGRPGSGKSYFAVKFLRDEFFKFDEKFDCYNPVKNKKNNTEYTIISNIENLNLKHIPLNYVCDLYSDGDILKFFTIKIQEKLHLKFKNIVYIIDECQQYFRYLTPKSDEETFFYFEKHRHFGDTFYLISQDSWRISKFLVALADKEVRAVSRAKTFSSNHMCYRELVGGTLTSLKHTKKDKSVFQLYKSMSQSEAVVPSGSKILLKLVIPLVVVVLSLLYFFNTFGKNSNVIASETQIIKEKNIVKNSSNNFLKEEKKYPQRDISFVKYNDSYLIYNPCSKSLEPLETIDFPIQYRLSLSGERVILTGRPPCEIKPQSPKSEKLDDAMASSNFYDRFE